MKEGHAKEYGWYCLARPQRNEALNFFLQPKKKIFLQLCVAECLGSLPVHQKSIFYTSCDVRDDCDVTCVTSVSPEKINERRKKGNETNALKQVEKTTRKLKRRSHLRRFETSPKTQAKVAKFVLSFTPCATQPRTTKEGSITVPLTSCLTGLD